MNNISNSAIYLRLPSRSVAKPVSNWQTQVVAFALAGKDGKVHRSNVGPLSGLAPQIARAQRVMLLLAASDVTLLRVAVPPLTGMRLQAALPALVEDKLITDPADCVLVAGPESKGMRTIAVVERKWLRSVVENLSAMGARRIVVLPSQLCLPLPLTGAAAAVTEEEEQIDLAVRTAEYEGMGVPIVPSHPEQTLESEVCQSLLALLPQRHVELSVPAVRLKSFQSAAQELTHEGTAIAVLEDNWARWIEGANRMPFDLMAGLHAGQSRTVEWRRWRWPIALATLLLLMNVLALNWDWWRLKSEADDLRNAMTRTYQKAFPNDKVIVDPLAQMKQKIVLLRTHSGEMAPGDFIALVAALGEALPSLQIPAGSNATPVASIEYRDATLTVRFRPGIAPPLPAARTALAARNISVTTAANTSGSEGETAVWLLRSTQ